MSTSPTLKEEDTIVQLSKPWANQTLLSKPLYVYHLPNELLQNLRLRSIDVQESEQTQEPVNTEGDFNQKRIANHDKVISSSGSCSICPKSPNWEGLKHARSHVRSDWHRYNSALVKKGRLEDCLDEDTFQQLIDDLSSESSSSEESETEGKERAPVDHVTALLKKLQVSSKGKTESNSEEDDERSAQSGITAKEPYLWFVTPPTSDTYIPQTQFGILRAQFPDSDGVMLSKDWHVTALKRMQTGAIQEQQIPQVIKRFKGSSAANEASSALAAVFVDASGEKPDEGDSSDEESGDEASVDEAVTVTTSASVSSSKVPTSPMRTWTIILLGGGNFSAITIALNPRYHVLSKKKSTSEIQYLILARKQIHRYTTRRKQGGAQSAQDASGKFAKSAGAQLRRYGEQALAEEIRALFSTKAWRDCIGNSERVWIRAGLKSARGILWNWTGSEESPLDAMRKEDKVQSLPIATRKPTVGECLRCFAELTKVRVRHHTEEELQARDDMYRAQLENSARAKQERRSQEKEKLRREAEAKEAAVAAKKKAVASKLDEQEILRRERFTRLIDMIRKGRIENTVNHLEKYERELLKPNGWDSKPSSSSDPDDVDDAMEESKRRIDVVLPFWWRYQDAREKGALLNGQEELTGVKAQLIPSTLLQIAAEGGHANQVAYFLIERRSDPTISILPPPLIHAIDDDSSMIAKFPHRTAYDVCTSRDARDVFRKLMASQPNWCSNWSGMEVGGARVAKALTSEMEEAREKEEKIRDKRQAIKDKARQRQQEEEVKKAHEIDIAQIKAAAAIPPPPSSTSKNRLGGSGTTAPRTLQKERDVAAGLTPEARARIEREKRARAAEARFKSTQGGS